ncbi:MAG: hypothetical protein ACLSE4_09655 [Clostridium sp.]
MRRAAQHLPAWNAPFFSRWEHLWESEPSCVMASATNCKDYSENGRKSDIDIEDRAIRTAIETMRMLDREG